MVRCCVQVAADPDPPRVRDYEFVAVPRIGEWLSLEGGAKYRIIDVDHVPAGIESVYDWVNSASVVITVMSPKNA